MRGDADRMFRIGTRGSQLALWQARTVGRLIEELGATTELVIIKTSGDHLQDASLAEVGGKRLFVKEIEDALLRGEVHLAVHSAKDMPSDLPGALRIAGVLPREDPRDALVLRRGVRVDNLPDAVAAIGESPTIGTSSVRRIAQLSTLLPRSRFLPIRGNVDTRLRKLDDGGFDALVLASAGMKRLGFGARISAPIPIADCIPAPGQGIVAIETRADDRATCAVVERISDGAAAQSLEAERALVLALGGGCQLPLGAVALHEGQELELHAIVASVDGRRTVRRHARGRPSEAGSLGRLLADELSRAGATDILDEVRGVKGPIEGSY